MPRKQIDRQTAARVPDAEQPYPVPDNWAWVELQTCFAIVSEKIDPQIDHVLPYVGLEHIKKGAGLLALGQSDEVKSTKTAFKKNDVLYGKLRPYLDKHFVADIDGICSTDILVLRANQHSSAPFLNYYFSVPCVIQYAIEHSHGIHLPRVSPKDIGKMPLPLPPLAEQRRIVATLDSLLGKLRAARDLLDAARDSFALRRAAILHKAFSGQLTAAWRKEHLDLARPEFEECQEQPYKLPETWKWVNWEHLLANKKHSLKRGPFGSAIKKIFFVPQGYKVYEQQNAIYNDFSLGTYYINDEKYQELIGFKVEPGDLIVSCSGTIGKIAEVPQNAPAGIINQALLKITLDPQKVMTPFFLNLFESLDFQNRMLSHTHGSAIRNISSVGDLKRLGIPLPQIEEQREIVRRLDALLTHEAEAAALLDMDEHLDLLEQSILARAFRGELGTRDPADAPAVVE